MLSELKMTLSFAVWTTSIVQKECLYAMVRDVLPFVSQSLAGVLQFLCSDFSDLQQSIDNWVDCSHSLPCQEKHSNGKPCQGRRKYTGRRFIHGEPPFVIMAIDATVYCNGHPELQPPMLPSSVLLCNERYQPVAVRYHLESFCFISSTHWWLLEFL